MGRREKKILAKQVALAISGGLLEIVTELASDVYLPQANIIPGSQPYNAGDAVGLLEATTVTLFGILKEKPYVTLVGAGGLAVAFPNLLGKTIINAVTPAGTASAPMGMGGTAYTNTGRYGRNVALPAMAVITPKYARR